jgi:hypothetical protein
MVISPAIIIVFIISNFIITFVMSLTPKSILGHFAKWIHSYPFAPI